jgi:uncharacterized protein YhjY with autotransporter beta-barrel domain
MYCCSTVLTGTLCIDGRWAASQIANASIASLCHCVIQSHFPLKAAPPLNSLHIEQHSLMTQGILCSNLSSSTCSAVSMSQVAPFEVRNPIIMTGSISSDHGLNAIRNSCFAKSIHRRWLPAFVVCSAALSFLGQSSDATAQQALAVQINVVGLKANQRNAESQLNTACEGLDSNVSEQAAALQEVCEEIDELDPNDLQQLSRLQEITDAVAPEEAFALNDSLVVASDYQTTNVRTRLDALRKPQPITLTINNLENQAIDTASVRSGGGASSDFLSRAGAFINGQTSNGSIDGAALQQDSDISSNSLTFGADYRFGNNIIAGFGLGVNQDTTTYQNVRGSAESDGINITAFASWYETDQGYLDVVLDFGSAEHDLERSITLFEATPLTAGGSTDSTATSVTVSGGRSFSHNGWNLGGYFRMSHTRANITSYTESLQTQAPGYAALFSIGDQKIASSKLVVGFEVSKVISTTRAVIVPTLRMEYLSENERDKDDIVATLLTTNTVGLYQGQSRVSKYSNIGVGATAVFSGGRNVYAFYETHLKHDLVSQNWLKVGARIEF